MGKKKLRIPSADFGLIAMTLILIIFGVIMVFSASYYWSMDQYGKPYSYLIKDIVWAGAGICAMLFFSLIDYRKYKKHYKLILAVSVVLLLLLMTPLGKEAKGATRWLNLGITIMPGELAKLAAILFTAAFLSRERVNVNSLQKSVLPLLGVCAVLGGLIMWQPNMSTAVTVVGIIIAIMFVAGIKMSYFIGIGALGIAAGVVLIVAGGGYRLDRVTSFLHPFDDPLGDAFQVVQSLLAMGSGGLFGQGLGDSVQKTLYLPEPQNDFILAIIGEELGFIGVLAMIAAFVFLIWRGLRISMKAPDRFGFLLGTGVMMMIGIQLVLNIAIVTSSMPPTGVALPFISYGGNAMILFCSAMGMVLNISRHVRKAELDGKKEVEQRRVYFNRGAK